MEVTTNSLLQLFCYLQKMYITHTATIFNHKSFGISFKLVENVSLKKTTKNLFKNTSQNFLCIPGITDGFVRLAFFFQIAKCILNRNLRYKLKTNCWSRVLKSSKIKSNKTNLFSKFSANS